MRTNLYKFSNRSGGRRKLHLSDGEGGTLCVYGDMSDKGIREVNQKELSWKHENCLICAHIYMFGTYPNNEVMSDFSERGMEALLDRYE